MPTNAEIHSDITLYITGQRSHILNNTVAQVFHDMVDNIDALSGGGASIADITYAALLTAISGSTLTAGGVYKITDRGDRGLFFTAISTNELSRTGIRKMLCPARYNGGQDENENDWIGVWKISKVVVENQLTIWGGKVWINISGNIGTADDDVTLSGVDWTVIPKVSFSNGEYVEMQFGVSYDAENDWVERQWDKKGNEVGVSFVDKDILSGNFNPGDVTDWNYGTSEIKFLNNKSLAIFNNSNDGNIDANICVRGQISGNSNGGIIEGNICSNGIISNSNDGDILDNIVYRIVNNSNEGEIRDNIIPNDISNNSNGGNITFNCLSHSIEENTNTGNITDNIGNKSIFGDSRTGNITGFRITDPPEFADNAAAVTGGLSVGQNYRTGDALKIVH